MVQVRKWDPATRYQILLKINNAIVTQTRRDSLFRALARELRKHFQYDRLSINIYDPKNQSLSYFAAADGVNPEGISCLESRPLAMGAVAKLVIETGKPVVMEDLTKYRHLSSVVSMLESGLRTTMAFPLIVRKRILGSIHFSYRKAPPELPELKEVLEEVSKQVAIAVDNMLSYEELKKLNEILEGQKRYLMASAEDRYREDSFFYASRAIREIMEQVRLVADTDASVLITGETGTGKDYIARTIHRLSSRRNELFVKVNCPALASTLFESELFGHAKGAFTGADTLRVGRLEMAQGGTVFFDEVGDLPHSLQAKLLHVLQDGTFERVGESRPIKVDFRVISATNQDLQKAIREGRFRRDLYYRLNTVHIHIPPLRERPEDIPILVEKLTELQAREANRPAPKLTPEALRLLCHYEWPGNVRELKNLVKRLVILRPGDLIGERDVDGALRTFAPELRFDSRTLAEVEKDYISQVMRRCGGRLGGADGAAKVLGIPRSTLQHKLKKLGLDPREFRMKGNYGT
jgi:transcriptional regulator with GAF, ATPase, and Fis domain